MRDSIVQFPTQGEGQMRHARQYADVTGLQGSPSDVGFLGVPRAVPGVGVTMVLAALLFIGIAIGAGVKGLG